MSAQPNQLDVPVVSSVAGTEEQLSIRVCRDWDELEKLRNEWDLLLDENPRASIFLTPEWQASWWHAFGRDKQLLGLVFTDASGKTAGIAPLYSDTKSVFVSRIRILRLVGAGSGDSDALDFITRPGSERMCAEAFVAWLAKERRWNVCSLETLPQNSLVGRHVSQLLDRAGWQVLTEELPNFQVDLPRTWQEYLQGLQPQFRPLLTRYPKRLQLRYSVSIARCERSENLDSDLETLFALHQMRWTGQGKPGAFSSTERRDFYMRMSKAFLRRGWLEFWLLKLDNETVAAQFCFRYGDTVSLLQEGFNPRYAADKIGYALRAHVLQEMIRTGARRYDFLGGSDQYKSSFGAHQESYLSVHFAGPSLLGRVYLAQRRQSAQLKRWLKNKLPAPVLAALQHQGKRQAASA
jgi:CelD/BcsL family acetyltransferase involved in cellulose biosynthesis